MNKLTCKKCGAVYTSKGQLADEITCFCMSKDFRKSEE